MHGTRHMPCLKALRAQRVQVMTYHRSHLLHQLKKPYNSAEEVPSFVCAVLVATPQHSTIQSHIEFRMRGQLRQTPVGDGEFPKPNPSAAIAIARYGKGCRGSSNPADHSPPEHRRHNWKPIKRYPPQTAAEGMRLASGVGHISSHALQAAKPHLYPRLTLTREKPFLWALL